MTQPDPIKARARYNSLARRYDRSLLPFRPWLTRYRRQAVAALHLRQGDTVYDVGAGTGASLGALSTAVGPNGRVMAIEPSDAMLDVAARRCREAAWSNVEFAPVTAQDVTELPPGDAALFFLTHDIVRTPAAITNIISQLGPGARVVSFGMRAGGPGPIRPVMRRFIVPFVTTLDGLDKPWEHIATLLEDFRPRTRGAGIAYLASGRVPNRHA